MRYGRRAIILAAQCAALIAPYGAANAIVDGQRQDKTRSIVCTPSVKQMPFFRHIMLRIRHRRAKSDDAMKPQYRYLAKERLAKATELLKTGAEDDLTYACLELRKCIEALS